MLPKLRAAQVRNLLTFMHARHNIWLARQAGKKKPWTQDPILQNYRFCNVYRELDTVTVWIREHIREPYAQDPHLWFMLAAARQINLPGTLNDLLRGSVLPPGQLGWRAEAARRIMRDRHERGEKVYTNAYMLTSKGRDEANPDKPHYTCHTVLRSAWHDRKRIEATLTRNSLAEAHAALVPLPGWGSFTAAQVVADLKYTRYLKTAPDWWTWAASGPGSRRGLNLLCGRELDTPWREADWLETLQELRYTVNDEWPHEPLHAQDVQNCLCEYFKYNRGWSRTKYPGAQ